MSVIINKMKVENDGHQFYQEVIYSLKKVMCHSLYSCQRWFVSTRTELFCSLLFEIFFLILLLYCNLLFYSLTTIYGNVWEKYIYFKQSMRFLEKKNRCYCLHVKILLLYLLVLYQQGLNKYRYSNPTLTRPVHHPSYQVRFQKH